MYSEWLVIENTKNLLKIFMASKEKNVAKLHLSDFTGTLKKI
jgi:hypothetical protein